MSLTIGGDWKGVMVNGHHTWVLRVAKVSAKKLPSSSRITIVLGKPTIAQATNRLLDVFPLESLLTPTTLRKPLDRDSLIIGVILGVLAQTLYDILKFALGTIEPNIPTEYIYLYAGVAAMITFVLVWRAPILWKERHQKQPTYKRDWLYIGIGLGLSLSALIPLSLNKADLNYDLLALGLVDAGFLISVLAFLHIFIQPPIKELDSREEIKQDWEERISSILEEELKAINARIDSLTNEIKDLREGINKAQKGRST